MAVGFSQNPCKKVYFWSPHRKHLSPLVSFVSEVAGGHINKQLRIILLIFLFSSQALSFELAPEYTEQEINEHPAWEDSKVTSLQASTLFTKKIPLTVVVTKRSTFKLDEVTREIRLAEEVFSQCEFSFSPITIVEARTTMGVAYSSDGSDEPFFSGSPFVNRPVIVMDYISQKPKSVDPGARAGYANFPKYTDLDSPSLHTGFVFKLGTYLQRETARATKEKLLSIGEGGLTPDTYSVLAHELAHILFNSGHSKEHYNILRVGSSDRAYVGHQIDVDSQCSKISESFFTD